MSSLRPSLVLALLLAAATSSCVLTRSIESADYATPTAWRGWKQSDVPAGWVFEEDGVLHLAEPGAGDLITRSLFEDFVLTLSWKISPGGNSGILFRATEQGGAIYESAPEMQILDDGAYPDATPLTMSGSNYALHPTLERALRPQGEWNGVRLTVEDGVVTHELNGIEVLQYELGSPEWEALVADSKFEQWPIYGRAERGHVGLQDHGNEVWFKDIEIVPILE